jgi:hypothetical protein
MQKDPEFRALIEHGRENATQYMRSKMLELAYSEEIPPNVRSKMLIWLSQKYLGMGQKIETEGTLALTPVIVRIPTNGREPDTIDTEARELPAAGDD